MVICNREMNQLVVYELLVANAFLCVINARISFVRAEPFFASIALEFTESQVDSIVVFAAT